ncbi:MAG: lipopolysaccharide biosynthesis protein [Treponemataceae bacterium]|nr:lipopolysaccharide biosynthesis protein [Treponemataceae bacterium]
MTPAADDDEISLIDLFAVLLRYKVMIIVLTVVAAVGAVVFSIISLVLPPEKSPLPNQFTPEAHMLITESSSGGSGLSSMLSSSGLGSLASLAGFSGSAGSSNSSLAVYLISSNPLLDAVTDTFGIVERYKIEKYVRASSRKALKKTLSAEFDDETGIFTVSFTDIDPVFAQRVVNFVIDWRVERCDELGLDNNKIKKENLEKNIQSSYNEILRLEREARNLGASVSGGAAAWDIPSIATGTTRIQMELEAQKEVYTQLKIQYEMLKVEMQSEQPIFQILERPEIPDQKSKPSRGMLCIIIMFAAFFLSVFLAFARNAFRNIRNDPEAWGKLTQKQDKDN